QWAPEDRLVCALPLFHMHGLGVAVNGTLLAGASMVLLPRFGVAEVLDAARDHRASLFFGVPTMYSRLAASPRAGELSALSLVGRATELIITGGFNVYPREVEDVLRDHPAVRDAAVVGRPDPEWGEVVTAFCVGDPVPDDELAAYCAERLAAFKRPRRWRW